jgi:raffinose/stachyose/melibiose transport system permease protein
MKAKKRWIFLFLLPGTLIFLFIYFASIVSVFFTSFADWRIGGKITFNGVKNYLTLFGSDAFHQGMWNTIIWIVLQSTIHVTIGTLFAILTVKENKVNHFSKTVFMLPNMVSSAALGMLFYNVFNPSYGPVNKLIKLLGNKSFNVNWYADSAYSFFAVTITWLPFAAMVTILCAAELSAISQDIFEAAIIDGASEFQINTRIKLPLIKNAIGTGMILAATSMLQKIDVLIMTSNGGPGNATMNLPLLIYNTALVDNNFGLANAAGVVLIVVGLVAIGLITKIFSIGEAAA